MIGSSLGRGQQCNRDQSSARLQEASRPGCLQKVQRGYGGHPCQRPMILLSGVARQMAANGSGLQRATIRNIVHVWGLSFLGTNLEQLQSTSTAGRTGIRQSKGPVYPNGKAKAIRRRRALEGRTQESPSGRKAKHPRGPRRSRFGGVAINDHGALDLPAARSSEREVRPPVAEDAAKIVVRLGSWLL